MCAWPLLWTSAITLRGCGDGWYNHITAIRLSRDIRVHVTALVFRYGTVRAGFVPGRFVCVDASTELAHVGLRAGRGPCWSPGVVIATWHAVITRWVSVWRAASARSSTCRLLCTRQAANTTR